GLCTGVIGPLARALLQDCMYLVPEGPIDDRFMLARIGSALVHGIAYIDLVVEELVEHTLVQEMAIAVAFIGGDQLAGQQGCRLQLNEATEDALNTFSIGLMDNQLAVANLVSERRPSSHPDALLARGRNLIADALPNQLSLELRKSDEDVEHH